MSSSLFGQPHTSNAWIHRLWEVHHSKPGQWCADLVSSYGQTVLCFGIGEEAAIRAAEREAKERGWKLAHDWRPGERRL